MKKKSFLTSVKAFLVGLAVTMVPANLSASLCNQTLTNGGNSITVTSQCTGTNTYQLVITSSTTLNGLGGTFANKDGVGGYDIRTNMSGAGTNTITCTITSTTVPNIYTPLYVLMPGEVAFSFPTTTDAFTGACVTTPTAPTISTFTAGSSYIGMATINMTCDMGYPVATMTVTLDGTPLAAGDYNSAGGVLTVSNAALTEGSHTISCTLTNASGTVTRSASVTTLSTPTSPYCSYLNATLRHLGLADGAYDVSEIYITYESSGAADSFSYNKRRHYFKCDSIFCWISKCGYQYLYELCGGYYLRQ